MRDVEVWRLDCAGDRDAVDAFEAPLNTDERARLGMMRSRLARRHFAAGRWLVRHVLARRFGCTTAEVALTEGAHGRPTLVSGDLDFNISHVGSRVVLALSTARVGIDIEALDRPMRWRSIARRFFSAAENAAIEACAEGDRRTAFLRVWVRKEAFVKALGTGVATGLDRFDVSAGAEGALIAARLEGVRASEWSIRDFDSGPGHIGAVAARAAGTRLVIHDAGS